MKKYLTSFKNALQKHLSSFKPKSQSDIIAIEIKQTGKFGLAYKIEKLDANVCGVLFSIMSETGIVYLYNQMMETQPDMASELAAKYMAYKSSFSTEGQPVVSPLDVLGKKTNVN